MWLKKDQFIYFVMNSVKEHHKCKQNILFHHILNKIIFHIFKRTDQVTDGSSLVPLVQVQLQHVVALSDTFLGATFHKDPNWTSAWNGLISGKKKWLFYPPDAAPLGVIPSDDGLQVTVYVMSHFIVSVLNLVVRPSTMVQWFMDFYPQKPPVKPIECIQNPGTSLLPLFDHLMC